MTTVDPPRHPAGSPASEGGQFAPQQRQPADLSELSLDLSTDALSDEDYNRHGTFAFPPHPRSAQQMLAFWRDVDVPDYVLREVQDSYLALQAQDARHFNDEYAATVPADSRANYDKARAEYESRSWPSRIANLDARSIVKGASIHRNAHRLPDAERAAVDNMEFVMEDGTHTTPRQIWEDYRFKWTWTALDATGEPAPVTGGMSEEQRRINEQTLDTLGSINENIRNVGYDPTGRIDFEGKRAAQEDFMASRRPGGRRRG